MIAPEMRLIHAMCVEVRRSRRTPTPKLSVNHQAADPAKTPATMISGEPVSFPSIVPAKMAAKERMVIGLVMVRKKVDVYMLNRLPCAA